MGRGIDELLMLADGNGIRGQPLRLLQLVHQRGEVGGLASEQGRPSDAGHRT